MLMIKDGESGIRLTENELKKLLKSIDKKTKTQFLKLLHETSKNVKRTDKKYEKYFHLE